MFFQNDFSVICLAQRHFEIYMQRKKEIKIKE